VREIKNPDMKIQGVIYLMILSAVSLEAQTANDIITGKVSFKSSQNIYVKFRSTSGISAGDTLFISSGDTLLPSLKVENLSSVSCLCTPITDADLPADHLIIAKRKTGIKTDAGKPAEEVKSGTSISPVKPDSSVKKAGTDARTREIRGSISAISYSDFSNTGASDSWRFRYTLSLQASNIADSKVSVESYMSFRHKTGEWYNVRNDLFSALKIYALAARYDFNESSRVILGRKINPLISGMGALDGVQVEKTFNNFTAGLLAGTRPDFTNYSFNPDLLQYGAWMSLNTKLSDASTMNSVAFVNQMNKSKTDRRFLYFQHSNSLLKNTYFFSSFEIDLYKLENERPKGTLSITGMYMSLRINMVKKLSLTGSYDARKNVIYYESYKTFTDRLLRNELRQGFRLNANWRINGNMISGVQAGYRFMKTDPFPSKNIYGYFTYNTIPGLNASATLSGTFLKSAHINGRIAGLNLSRNFSGDFQAGLGYHFIDYKLPESKLDIIQHISEVNLSWYIFESTSLSVYYEGIFEQENIYNRIYLQLRKRF
jgi:hypothetical protein